MFFNHFLLILILQMLCYSFVDYTKIKFGRLITLTIFLSIYLILLPNFFSYTEPKDNVGGGMICSVYAFEYFEIYWFIGIALILIAHLIYCVLLNKKLISK
jgi:formate hydrogenlyase subunit 3/multisubunit Na+/H+ antiporter MnhD subunit